MAQSYPVQPAPEVGDDEFRGVNCRLAPENIPPGYVAWAENYRFRDGDAVVRRGVAKPQWLNSCYFPAIDDGAKPESGRIASSGSYYGHGEFKQPDGREWHIIVSEDGIFRHVSHNGRVELKLPDGVRIRSSVRFSQAFDKIFMFRGRYLQPLVMSDLEAGFVDMIERWDSTKAYSQDDRMAYGPWKTAASIVCDETGTALATFATPHGYVTGADLIVKGANEGQFNGRWNVTVIDELSLSYVLKQGFVAGSATGTIKVSNSADYWRAKAATLAGESPETHPAKWGRDYMVLPNADGALYINNMLLVPTAWTPGTDFSTTGSYTKVDFIVATDFLDPFTIDFTDELRINQGGDDEIVGLLKVSNDQVLVIKQKSVGILSGVRYGLKNVTLDMRGETYGGVAAQAAVVAGDVPMWVSSRRGVVSLRETELGKLQSRDVPFSNDMQGVVSRINWTAAAAIRMAYWNDCLYVAVPMDKSKTNNAMMVYDFRAEAWAGIDTGTAICPQEFFEVTYLGQRRLCFFGTDGFVSMVEHYPGKDEFGNQKHKLGVTSKPIRAKLVTRQYMVNTNQVQRWRKIRIPLSTLGTSYQILVSQGGTGNEVLVQSKTVNPNKIVRPFDAKPRDPSNSNDDFNNAGREDYSLMIPASGFVCGSGIKLGQFQDSLVRVSARPVIGRTLQVTIHSQGAFKIMSVGADGVEGSKQAGAYI